MAQQSGALARMDGGSYFVLAPQPRSGCNTPDTDLEGDPDLLFELEDDSEDDLLDEVSARRHMVCVVEI